MNHVILHLSSGGKQIQRHLFTQISNIKRELPQCQVEVVTQGETTKMLKRSSIYFDEIQEKMRNNTVFTACRNSLNALHVEAQDLINGVKVVNSALAHIIIRQQQNCAYIKIGN